MTDTAEDFSESINLAHEGWTRAMGISLVRATREEVIAELEVGPMHFQAYGVVHGGVYAGLVESAASVGAALDAMSRGQSVVGLENQTSFVRAVRSGRLRARAIPLTRGRKTQLWDVTVHDGEGRLAATGRVRLLCLDAGAALGGEAVGFKPPR